MKVDLHATEERILEVMKELCGDYNFQRYAHPGSLSTLGFVVNKVTALLQYVRSYDERPRNLTAPCANVITYEEFNVEIIWIDYRGHHKIYELACAIQDILNYRRDLLVFKGTDNLNNNTQHQSWASDLRFMEIDNKDNG